MLADVNISLEGLDAVLWTMTGVAVPLTIGRYCIRRRTRGRFYADDLMHLFSLLSLIATASIAQSMFPYAKRVVYSPHPAVEDVKTFKRLQLGLNITLFTTLWAVKVTFMLFYRLLFWISPSFRRAWWVCMVFICLTYWIPVGGSFTVCGSASDLTNLAVCAKTKRYAEYHYIYTGVFNVLTDLCLIALPLWMLSGVQIPRGQKTGLAFLFSVAFVTIALEILRVVEGVQGGNMSNALLYDILEMTFAVYLSCLPTYRALLGIDRKTNAPVYQPWLFSRTRVQNNQGNKAANPASADSEAQGGFELLDAGHAYEFGKTPSGGSSAANTITATTVVRIDRE